MECETCVFYVWDDEFEEYRCDMDMDEDDAYRIQASHYKSCPYYRNGDDYLVVRHQM